MNRKGFIKQATNSTHNKKKKNDRFNYTKSYTFQFINKLHKEFNR